MSEGLTNPIGQRLDLPDPSVALTGVTMGGTPFKIIGSTLQAAILNLNKGNHFYSETGSMSWMGDGVTMETNMGGGGLGGLFKRAITGESLFVVNYTTTRDGAMVAFSADFPGKIVPINLTPGQSMIAQRGAFLLGEKSINLSIAFRSNFSFLGGEGFIMQRFDGPGTMFVAFDGEIYEHTLQPGEKLRVDTGHVAMFESSVQYNVEMVKGFKNMLFGGEGLMLATLTGPGRVWLQTMPMTKLAGALMQYMPKAEGSNSSVIGGLGNLLGGGDR